MRPSGIVQPLIEYSNRLLEQNQYEQSPKVMNLHPGEKDRVVSFLRGYALEKMGMQAQAQREYDIVRTLTSARPGIDDVLPMASKYRIEGSALQHDIRFDDEIHIASHCTAHNELAKMMQCEAGGEGIGGRRAVGWVARNRVFNGSLGYVSITNSGTTTCAKYHSVLYQGQGTSGPEFSVTCSPAADTDSVNVAFDVWWGLAPETSTGWCPSGEGTKTPACSASCTSCCSASCRLVGYTFMVEAE
jgi:hypothetical protein